jgi:outer membrane beta-barrel protein
MNTDSLFRKCLQLIMAFAFAFLQATDVHGQRSSLVEHEIAPFIGFYAPDRFETSMAFGVRYYYYIDQRLGVGAIIGLARAKQDFLRQVSNLTVQTGSDRVLFHGARVTHAFPAGKVEPYLVFHLGLTRLYDENNFTYGVGVGTKVYFKNKFSLRYEFLNYIFSSGRDRNAWTNKNLEVSFILGFYL